MNKRAMFFLKRRVNLIMVIKIFLKIFLFLLTYKLLFSEIIYEKNNVIITEFDIKTYQQLYKENYGSEINRSNSRLCVAAVLSIAQRRARYLHFNYGILRAISQSLIA